MARPKRHLRDFKHDYKQSGAREDVTFTNPVRDSHGEYRRFGNRSRDDRYDGLFEGRGERRRRERSSDQFNHRRRSESPPLSPRVTILKHSVNLDEKKANINDQFPSSANQLSPAAATSPQIIKPAVSLTQSQLQNASFSSSTNQNFSHGHSIPSAHMSQNIEELLNDMIENMPPVIKLIDPDSWSFLEHPASEFLFSDSVTGPGGFTVISAVGMQSVGKSMLLNKIAGRNVFKTHRDADNSQAYLKHLTRGVDLHVSKERLLLLDCQPMMTASILDEYISKNSASSNSMLTDACEPEIYVYITSLQLLSFLIAVCDYLIVTSDWILDVHLIKLLATAMMMVGTDAHRAELIFHFPQLKDENRKKIMKTIQTIFGGDSSNIVKDIIDDKISLPRLMKLLHRKNTHYQEINSYSSERSWLFSAQRFWENSVRKSSLFSDYARLML